MDNLKGNEPPKTIIVGGAGVEQGAIQGEKEFLREVARRFREGLINYMIDSGSERRSAEITTKHFLIARKPHGYDFGVPMYLTGQSVWGMLCADDDMNAYGRTKGIAKSEKLWNRTWELFKGTNLRDLLDTYNEGFVRKNCPQYCIDLDEIAKQCNFDLDAAVHR